MAVVRITLHWAGSTGSRSREQREYTAVYAVETSDQRDQAAVVSDAFDGVNAPGLSTPYVYGNDIDTDALCDRIDPQREPGSGTKWQVTLHYATIQRRDEQRDDPDTGLPTSDPLCWVDDVELIPLTVTRPVEKATYRSGFVGDSAVMCPAGTEIIPVNSAMVPFDPPLEREDRRTLLRYTTRKDTYNPVLDDFAQAVNSEDVTFFFAYQALTVTIPKYKGQVVHVSQKFATASIPFFGLTQLRKYWELRYEILIDWVYGHRRQVIDRGLHAGGWAGSPDGKGGTISPGSDPEGFLVAGRPRARVLTGGDGHAITEPVLLNGAGQPLVPGAAAALTPVYLTYTVDREVSFALLGIPLGP